jgi:hypothetical protein
MVEEREKERTKTAKDDDNITSYHPGKNKGRNERQCL